MKKERLVNWALMSMELTTELKKKFAAQKIRRPENDRPVSPYLSHYLLEDKLYPLSIGYSFLNESLKD